MVYDNNNKEEDNRFNSNWKSDFLQELKSRNSRETDCFIDLFSSCNFNASTDNYNQLDTGMLKH